MAWLGMLGVVVVTAACITLVFVAARRTGTGREQMAHRQAPPATLSVLLDPQGRIMEMEAHRARAGRHLRDDPGPWTWQDLEPDYDIVSERWINDDEHGQVKLLQLRVKQQ